MKGTPLRLLIVFLCTAGSLLILQHAFDTSDHRKAEHAVRDYAPQGKPLAALVESRAPGGAWSSEITHGCRGVVRVRYEAPSAQYEFDYDVPAHAIHPGNEIGLHALEDLTRGMPVATDGGAPRG